MTSVSSSASQIDTEVRKAVRHFWRTRISQARSQGAMTGLRDTGARAAVTGGAQMDGFTDLIREMLERAGVLKADIYHKRKVELPGWYRAEKKWDLLVIVDDELLAIVELKSQVGPSFGNNFNNRAEEAIGNSIDLWAAYREGAFKPSARPWLGYLMMLEESPRSTSPVRVGQPHFGVFEEFEYASYAKRYEILLTKLVRERLYDSTCFLLSNRASTTTGAYKEPAAELSFSRFISSLLNRATEITISGED